jgi:CHAT domain-containing protein
MQEVGALYPASNMLGPDESTVEGISELFEPASIAHIACHASFQVENPMFSALRLADGDLNVYDMERMRRVPQLVVLSACDSGFSEALPGEELMGLSAALLSMGTRSIVASVGLVPDSNATRSLMTDFHRHTISGRPPSQALSMAQAALQGTPEGYVAAASFVCIGAG